MGIRLFEAVMGFHHDEKKRVFSQKDFIKD